MARKVAEKPMLPLAQPGHIQCAADKDCRKPGRLWAEGFNANERICVDHYYVVLDKLRAA